MATSLTFFNNILTKQVASLRKKNPELDKKIREYEAKHPTAKSGPSDNKK